MDCIELRQTRSSLPNDSLTSAVTTDQPEAPAGAVSYPPVDRGWPAWRFVLASFTVDFFIWGGNYSYVGTTSLALGYIEMLLGILLCRRWPHLIQYGIWGGLLVYVSSFVAASFAQSVAVLILCQGVLAGAAGGFVYAPIYVWLSEWFQERRALAGGTVFSGAGAGGFVFPLILNALLPRVGFRWTLRIFAAMQFLCVGVALLGMKPRIPPTRPVKGTGQNTPIEWKIFTDSVLLLFSATIIAQGFMISPISVYLPSYSTSFASPFVASLTLSILNIASVPGQILTGYLCDRFPYPKVMLGSGLISLLSIFALLRVGDTVAKVIGFSCLMGFTAGGFSSTWFPAAVDIAGKSKNQAGPIFGYLSCLRGAAAIGGPIFAGLVYHPKSTEISSLGKYGFGNFVLFVGLCGVGTAAGAVAVEGARRLRDRW